jgi:hypothetical protein
VGLGAGVPQDLKAGSVVKVEAKRMTVEAQVGEVIDMIERETLRAMNLHAGMASLHEAYSVILEELDEFWEQVKTNPKKLTDDQRAARQSELRKELVQVAAMCVRTLVDLDM